MKIKNANLRRRVKVSCENSSDASATIYDGLDNSIFDESLTMKSWKSFLVLASNILIKFERLSFIFFHTS